MDAFAARLDRQGDQITVFLSGELDLASAPTLDRVLDGVTGRIRFDCAELEFLDSSGMAVFARVERNGGATLRGVRPNVRRVLEIAGMDCLILNP